LRTCSQLLQGIDQKTAFSADSENQTTSQSSATATPLRILVPPRQRARNRPDAFYEKFRLNYRRVRTPAQHPAFDFLQSTQAHPHTGFAARQFGHLLAGMPKPTAELIGCPGIELDDDLEITLRLPRRYFATVKSRGF
jgi:hypothetical protein